MANENQLIEVRVPDIGNYKDVEVIDVLFKQGDAVEVDTPLITLETEKATMDVPSTAAGVVREARLQRGSRVSQGDVIAVVEMSATSPAATSPAQAGEVARSAGEGRKVEPSPQPSPATAGEGARPSTRPGDVGEGARPSPRPSPAGAGEGGGPSPARAGAGVIDEPGFSRAHASPSIRKLARELGVDLAKVQGTGAKGRITDADVKAWVKRALTTGAGV